MPNRLRSAGLNEAEFEINLREESARQLLQGAVLSGVEMPAAYAETLVAYVSQAACFHMGIAGRREP